MGRLVEIHAGSHGSRQKNPPPTLDYERTEREHAAMPAVPQPFAPAEGDLEFAADQAIEACGGHARQAMKALLAAVDFLEANVDELKGAVSNGYARGRYVARPDRKE